MYYAIQTTPNGGRHYVDNGGDGWQDRPAIEAAIADWRQRVTPRHAAATKFDIKCDGFGEACDARR